LLFKHSPELHHPAIAYLGGNDPKLFAITSSSSSLWGKKQNLAPSRLLGVGDPTGTPTGASHRRKHVPDVCGVMVGLIQGSLSIPELVTGI
jgi:hypothetical protein